MDISKEKHNVPQEGNEPSKKFTLRFLNEELESEFLKFFCKNEGGTRLKWGILMQCVSYLILLLGEYVDGSDYFCGSFLFLVSQLGLYLIWNSCSTFGIYKNHFTPSMIWIMNSGILICLALLRDGPNSVHYHWTQLCVLSILCFWWIRLPFMYAALLNAINFIMYVLMAHYVGTKPVDMFGGIYISILLELTIGYCCRMMEKSKRQNFLVLRRLKEIRNSSENTSTIIPEQIPHPLSSTQLKNLDNTTEIVVSHQNVTIMVVDIVEFTKLFSILSLTIVEMLNHVFSYFDSLLEPYKLEKIKTIGDAYVVAGFSTEQSSSIIQMALDILEAGLPFSIRIGIHTGVVNAGIVGRHRVVFDLWGPTVKRAHLLQTQCPVNKVLISDDTLAIVRPNSEKNGIMMRPWAPGSHIVYRSSNPAKIHAIYKQMNGSSLQTGYICNPWTLKFSNRMVEELFRNVWCKRFTPNYRHILIFSSLYHFLWIISDVVWFSDRITLLILLRIMFCTVMWFFSVRGFKLTPHWPEILWFFCFNYLLFVQLAFQTDTPPLRFCTLTVIGSLGNVTFVKSLKISIVSFTIYLLAMYYRSYFVYQNLASMICFLAMVCSSCYIQEHGLKTHFKDTLMLEDEDNRLHQTTRGSNWTQKTFSSFVEFSNVGVLFANIENFEEVTKSSNPREAVHILNDVFALFDDIVESSSAEKIKTSDSIYMVASGLSNPDDPHNNLKEICSVALKFCDAIEKYNLKSSIPLQVRIGLNQGTVIGGTIGKKKLSFDIWGDCVNVASRLESTGLPGRIQLPYQLTHKLPNYQFEHRGKVFLKGKGDVSCSFLLKKDEHDHRGSPIFTS